MPTLVRPLYPARNRGAAALTAVVLTVALCCCSGASEPSPGGRSGGTGGRVVLIGIDGADWRVIRPLMERGETPHLSRIVAEGSSGVLRSMEPSASPSLWTTVATGVGPERHGIHGFVVPEPSGDVRPVTSSMRRAPAFWNILPQFERRAGVVGWLVTWPAEPVDGFMVSAYLPYLFNWSTGRPLKGTIVDGIPQQTYPPELIDELAPLKVAPADLDPALLARFYDPSRIAGLGRDELECIEGFRWSVACDETYRHIGLALFDREPVDLFAIYFGGADVASHRFWKFANPEAMAYGVTEEEAAVLGRVIDAYYIHLDAMIGEYLQRLGADDTLVIISDHGFKPVLIPGRPTTSAHHRMEGIIALWGRGIRRGGTIDAAGLLDVLPTLLALLDVPLSMDLEGRVLEQAFEPAWALDHRPRFVDRYQVAESPRGPDASEVDPNVLERLRSLGYID
jgi:predicted AlkP superfamily pyrophosphatase or phosphodiesterase